MSYLHIQSINIYYFCSAANYGAISPILHRGRFAVIPEEPQGSPAQGTPPTGGALRSPSPEWDFDIEQVRDIHKSL